MTRRHILDTAGSWAFGIPGLLALLLGGPASTSTAQVPDRETQLATAVAPLPEARRAGARVLGFAENGSTVVLRDGTGEMICIADRPGDDEFHAACYHESLEPFMARGRELRSQGYSGAEVDSLRRAELEEEAWSMPDHPASLYSISGSADVWSDSTQTVSGGRSLYVVYTPYETGETTGLPTRPGGGRPWLMEAGSPWAHIMISGGE